MTERSVNAMLKRGIFLAMLVVLGLVIWNFATEFRPRTTPVMFSEFMAWVNTGQVARVTITGNEIRATTKGHDVFRTYSPGYGDLVSRLLEKGVQIEVKPETESIWTRLYSSALLLALAWAFPIAALPFAAEMLRRMRRIDDKLDRLLSGGGGGRAGA